MEPSDIFHCAINSIFGTRKSAATWSQNLSLASSCELSMPPKPALIPNRRWVNSWIRVNSCALFASSLLTNTNGAILLTRANPRHSSTDIFLCVLLPTTPLNDVTTPIASICWESLFAADAESLSVKTQFSSRLSNSRILATTLSTPSLTDMLLINDNSSPSNSFWMNSSNHSCLYCIVRTVS